MSDMSDSKIAGAATGDDHTRRILLLRLDQLRDPGWMQPVLSRALSQMRSASVAVADYAIEYCRVKPHRNIHLAVSATLLEGDSERPDRRHFSCTVFPSAERGQCCFSEQLQIPLPRAVRDQVQQAGYLHPAVFLSDPAIIVRLFPVDPVLIGLATATDMQAVARLLGGRGPSDAGPPDRITFEVLRYKPLHSCTLHYRGYRGNSPDAGEPPLWEAYGKVYRDDRAEVCHRLLKSAWEASQVSAGRWHAARPLACQAAERFVLQAAVAGRQFQHIFAERTHEDAGEAELRALERHLESLAIAIRSLQTSPLKLGPQNTFERLLAGQEKDLRSLRRWHSNLADELARLRRELVRLERESVAGPLGAAHCDLAHTNVMIDQSSVGLIDFDCAAQAEPAYDAAYFLTHMWSFGIRDPQRQSHIRRLCDFFRRAHLELTPDVSPQRLALYEALDFASSVLRNFRKHSHQENWLHWVRQQLRAAWGRLDEADGQTGGQP
jgi:thiamine kinase-like enzyme